MTEQKANETALAKMICINKPVIDTFNLIVFYQSINSKSVVIGNSDIHAVIIIVQYGST